MKQTTSSTSKTRHDEIYQCSSSEQDNRGQNEHSNSDVHKSFASFASGSPWARWIFNRQSVESVTRLAISDSIQHSSEKTYRMLTNCSSPTESCTHPSTDVTNDSPVSPIHPNWIYENLPTPITSAPAVPDILEASLGRSIKTTTLPILKVIDESSVQHSVQHQARLPHCLCRNMRGANIENSRSEDELSKKSHSDFVDRARMVSFKRKKVAPISSDGASCAQCTCFLDPVHLSQDSESVVNSNSVTYAESMKRHDYENTDNIMKTVILHTGFGIPMDATADLMLAMDSPKARKADLKIQMGNCDIPKVHLANDEMTKSKNKLNLTIDTSGHLNTGTCNGEKTNYSYDPLCEFLMSSPVMRKLKELGFQYQTFPTDICNRESRRLRILYGIIVVLLLFVLALFVLNFVPKIPGFQPSQPASASETNSSLIETTSTHPVISSISTNIGTALSGISTTTKLNRWSAPSNTKDISTVTPSFHVTNQNTQVPSFTINTSTDQPIDNSSFPIPAHFTSHTIAHDSSTTKIIPWSLRNDTTTGVTSLFPGSFPPDYTCPEDQFKCRAGISRLPCLYQWERCDGIADCSDGSDEELCDTIKCFGNFQCADKTCVALAKVCNGIFDCPDGSDELRCDKFKCQSYEFRCPSGYCIPKEWLCDGEADCPGHYDEYNCTSTCSSNHFRCPEGWCISSAWRCNGIRDCANGEDEQHCECPKQDQLKCASGGSRCVDKERICDGVSDCPDSSDEWNCVTLQNDALLIRDQGNDVVLPVCSQDWVAQDADLACRQLGYEKSDRIWEIALANVTEIFIKTTLAQTRTFNSVDRLQFLLKKKPVGACATRRFLGLTCQKYDCGHWIGDQTVHENRIRRMVGAISSYEHEWPSVAVLYHPQKKWACTASVIAPFWLITSALCVRRTDASPVDWKVIAGNADPSESDPNRQVTRSILRFVQHPSYKLVRTLLADYDIMLVQLSSPLPLSTNQAQVHPSSDQNLPVVTPICLPPRPTPPGTRCITAGWGYTNPGGYSINKHLKHLPVGIWPKEVCNSTAHYPGLLSERSICASNDRDDWGPCFNDEGAPLMCQYPGSPDRWYLLGVLTSQSCGSAVKHPSVYADVYAMRNWINGVIGWPVVN